MSTTQIIFFAVFLLLVAAFGWWVFPKKKNRKTAAFPNAWRLILKEKVSFYNQLSASEQTRFEEGILQFLDNVRITGVGEEVDDTDRLLVAASAVIPLFGFPGWHYRSLNEVLLYESAFNEDFKTREAEERNILGMVGGTGMTGTMILSKPSLHRAFYDQHSSQHVGIHEFVHLLDRADGTADGIPEALVDQPFVIPWVKLMHQEIKDIREGESKINPYGSTNEAEFFSVVSEYFFKQPDKLANRHPELYEMLEKIFRQDLDGK
ncbi:MAG: zinc-dependent peptidase [Saprospiraceae bacterium]|nr:zinc-dependent peptidase [Saprospiraceae bacterium]